MMKKYAFIFILFGALNAAGSDKDSTIYIALPDSVRAVSFLTELNFNFPQVSKKIYAGIQTDAVKLYLEARKKEKEIVFEYPKTAALVATGMNIEKEKGEISFKYDWKAGEDYKLMISQATDSARNFSLYSGYVFLPVENKWKLIGTCKILGRWNTLQQPASFYTSAKGESLNVTYKQLWIQRNNGSWKNMSNAIFPNPQINLFGHLDSVEQRNKEIAMIENGMKNGSIDATNNIESVYYKILNQGSGRKVNVEDTVSVFYHLHLLNDTTTVDEAKLSPARFPLKRLIRAWQIAIPLLNVGGKIRVYIPSDLAYSIRTRGAMIPPNSILVFDIEVVDAKKPQ